MIARPVKVCGAYSGRCPDGVVNAVCECIPARRQALGLTIRRSRPDTPAMSASPAKVRSVHSESYPDRVVNAVYEGILARRYAVGQRLVEADLVQDLGVSRGTIREALKQLAAAGVVKLEPHRGAFIRSLTRRDAEDLLLVLEVLCGLAARLAAQAIDVGANKRRFTKAMESILAYSGQVMLPGFLEERARFYQTMLDIGGNPELMRVMPVPQIHLFRLQFHGLVPEKELHGIFREYRDIAVAVLAGNVRLAESRMCRHIRRTGERIRKLSDSAFAREDE